MKFLCSNCKAKYQIADEKVAGRTLRMTCRQCQQEIVIRGDTPALGMPAAPAPAPAALGKLPPAPQPIAPAPSALARDFQRQARGEPMRASAPPPPPPPVLDAWHVAINDQPVGPIGREDVARKIATGVLNGESLAWREGLDDWLPIRMIPELAMLGIAAPPAPAPMHAPIVPAHRAELAPIGGRAGAAPAFTLDDWAPSAAEPSGMQPAAMMPAAMAPAPMQMAPAQMAPVDSTRAAPRTPSWGVMFAIACGFALLMSALTIFGAHLLSQPEPAQQAAVAPAPAAPAPAAAAQLELPESAQGEPEPMVIELDEVGVADQGAAGSRRSGSRTSSTSTSGTPASKASGPKRELTDAEKAMLARMGGGSDPQLAKLGGEPGGGTPTRSAAREGGLTAQELSKVVLNGRKNLQRCYETALRGSGSDDTVRIDVEVTVSPAGNVTGVQTTDGGLPGMKDCITRTVKMWRFPAASEPTTTKFPLVFQPGG